MATKKKLKTTNEEIFTAEVDMQLKPSSYIVTLPNGSRRRVTSLETLKLQYPLNKLLIQEVY